MVEIDSISEFRKNFTEIFNDQVKPELEKYENERIKTLTLARIIKYILFLICIFALIQIIFVFPDIKMGLPFILIGVISVVIPLWLCILYIFCNKNALINKDYYSVIPLIGFILVAIFFSIYSCDDYFLSKLFLYLITFFTCFSSAFLIYSCLSKVFENKFKEKIMNILIKAFVAFDWSKNPAIKNYEIEFTNLFKAFKEQQVDDNFTGIYKNMPVRISELKLVNYQIDSKGDKHFFYNVFKGILVMIDTEKPFDSCTIVRNRNLLFNKKKYQEVRLEDPEFQRHFFVDSSSQVEARVLLTPSFMEKYKKISNAFGSKHPSCVFHYTKIIFALPTNKDLFKLGKLDVPLTDPIAYEKLLNEFISILEMIDHLKLEQKI